MRVMQILIACVSVAVGAASALGQLTISISVPSGTSAGGGPVYVAGTFNNWNPGASGYTLTEQPDGRFAITLPSSVRGAVEFKFTRGSWDSVELNASGGDTPNRLFTIPATGAATYTGSVALWRGGWPLPNSTATPSVSIVSTSFVMPQLGDRTRRVWLYLPPGYAGGTRRYPVIYMHDGQNVFDSATSFAGEWGVDEALDAARVAGDLGAIVVAVDNGGGARLDEYSPWLNPSYNEGGEGDEYVDFLVDTLKPYVDANYRTLADRAHTGTIGSSMGGLIALYAALREPEVFGRAGVFSAALWFAPQIEAFAATSEGPTSNGQRFYFVCGANEGGAGVANNQNEMIGILSGAGFRAGTHLRGVVRADGAHAEWFWRREFPAAYRWLFPRFDVNGDQAVSIDDLAAINVVPTDADGDGVAGVFDRAALEDELRTRESAVMKGRQR